MAREGERLTLDDVPVRKGTHPLVRAQQAHRDRTKYSRKQKHRRKIPQDGDACGG